MLALQMYKFCVLHVAAVIWNDQMPQQCLCIGLPVTASAVQPSHQPMTDLPDSLVGIEIDQMRLDH